MVEALFISLAAAALVATAALGAVQAAHRDGVLHLGAAAARRRLEAASARVAAEAALAAEAPAAPPSAASTHTEAGIGPV